MNAQQAVPPAGGQGLDEQSVLAHVRERGLLPSRGQASVRRLLGGVSSLVFEVSPEVGRSLIVKKPLAELAVEQLWEADPLRAGIEASALQFLEGRLGGVPRLLDYDDAHQILTMEALSNLGTWKDRLLAGDVDVDVARRVGTFLRDLRTSTFDNADAAREFSNRDTFAALRIDPFYIHCSRVHPSVSGVIGKLLRRMSQTRRCLVHGDFTPKNVLVGSGNVFVVDWEIAHFGDPAFDIASSTAHLALKMAHAEEADRGRHAAAIREFVAVAGAPELDPDYLSTQVTAFLLARIDGKSPATYLTPVQSYHVRTVALQALEHGLDLSTLIEKIGGSH